MSTEEIKEFHTELQALLAKYDFTLYANGYDPDEPFSGVITWIEVTDKKFKTVSEIIKISKDLITLKT